MKGIFFMLSMLAAASAIGAAASEPVIRNPFWPIDYEGERFPISVKPRIQKTEDADLEQAGSNAVKKVRLSREVAADKAAKEAAAAAKRAEAKLWKEAQKALRFGGTMSFGAGSSFKIAATINDRIYSAGDLISVNHNGERFTWKIEALTSEGKITLRRIKHGAIKTEQQQ